MLILSGSSVIGRLPTLERIDFVRFPGVIKLYNGEYTPSTLGLELEETVSIRSAIIEQTAISFNPDLFVVDKEPLGLRGEVRDTLELLKKRGVPRVLGLRDVIDEPVRLDLEWQRKRVMPALKRLYDQLWVYGLKQIWKPLTGIRGAQSLTDKLVYTGYLRRRRFENDESLRAAEPFILVTPGGGGDGQHLIDQVLQAYEHDSTLPYRALIVLGPFMERDYQKSFTKRAERLERVGMIGFTANMESLVEQAVGIVAMGGYNTFCEILSFDKRAVIIPRSQPRQEQQLRARRMHKLGLCRTLASPSLKELVTAIHELPQQALPSQAEIPGLLDGLERIDNLASALFARSKTVGN